MDKKVGRNDPCPCGSGKKYKNCCMGKESQKKTYTAAGKRKFRASLIQTQGKMQSVFSSAQSQEEIPEASYIFLRYKQTEIDYRAEPHKPKLPFAIPSEKDKNFAIPQEGRGTGVAPEVFEMTAQDYRVSL